ncbi:oligosaccharide flippase family protein [Burkholderia vietnamiensis]|uniref:oligosaccharide flippase family protein n=1 Tax=Burkholderia vietnamiensis TaxID=60552 RepID=UPI000B250B94|nr:lipopolysaccharide biosynthesis protein [Burkholderia vietnamiensis]
MAISNQAEKSRTLSSHTFWYLLARGGPALVGFASVIAFARMLGPKEYGPYSLLIVAATTGNVVLFQWLRLSVLRFYPAYRHAPEIVIRSVLRCFGWLAAAVIVVGVIALYIAGDAFQRIDYVLAIPITVLIAWIELSLELKRANLEPKVYGAIMLLRAVLILVLGIATIAWRRSSDALLESTFVALFVTAAVCTQFWRHFDLREPTQDISRQLMRYGLPLTPAFAFNFFLSGFDRFFLGKVAGASAVGQYAAGADIALQSLGVVLMSINLASYPLIVRSHEGDDRKAVRAGLERNLLFYCLLATPLVVAFLCQSASIIHVLFGTRYSGATANVLSIAALSAIVFGLKNGHFDIAFSLTRRTELSLIPNAIGAAACVAAHLALTPRYGPVGAAVSSLVGYTSALVASTIVGRRLIDIPIATASCVRVVLCAVPMAALLLWIGPVSTLLELSSAIAAATLIFYGACYLALRPNRISEVA